jgi:hypothetical protein
MGHDRHWGAVVLLAALFSVPSCTIAFKSAEAEPEVAARAAGGEGLLADAGEAAAFPPGKVDSAEAQGEPGTAARARLLVHTGAVRLAVGSLAEASQAGIELAAALGGYAQEVTSESLVLRIPAPKWEEALAAVGRLGGILERQIRAHDVTEEVVDLRLRLQNALALRKRLEELLARADSVDEVLAVEKELTRVRTEVERLAGQLQLREHQVAFATLTLRFVQVAEAARVVNLPFAWLRNLGVERLLALESRP